MRDEREAPNEVGLVDFQLRVSSDLLPSKLSFQARLPFLFRNGTRAGPTADVERAHSDRARSGSKGLARVPFHPFSIHFCLPRMI
jgi:hypothetical protein